MQAQKQRRGIKVLIIILAAVFIIIMAGGFIAGNFFYNLALNPNSDKSEVLAAPHNQMVREEDEYKDAEREKNTAWYEDSDKEDVYIKSYDDLKLHATKIEAEASSDKWLIAIHGYTGLGVQMIGTGRHFAEEGYNVLLPDCRGHGDSEGDYIGMGWHDRLDVVSWIEELVSWNPDAEIALYGVSMGGATVMMTSGEDLPDNLKVIVEDCGYTSTWDEFSYQLKAIFNLPSFPLMNFSETVTKIRAGYGFKESSAINQVAKSKTPMMFIHGDADTFVPAEMVYEVYEAANVEKKLLVAPGAGHGGSSDTLKEEYWESVFEFVGRFIS